MDAIELLNTIRDNASQAYQDRVPEATRSNIESVGEAITDLSNAVVYNEFINTLANMIFAPMLIEKSWSNPLGKFKKGKKTFGDTVEEIYNNFIKAKTYDQSGAGLKIHFGMQVGQNVQQCFHDNILLYLLTYICFSRLRSILPLGVRGMVSS